MTAALSRLAPSLRRRVEAELKPGERVLWAGMPGPLQSLLPSLLLFVFGVGWSSLAFTWETVAIAGALGLGSETGGMSRGMAADFAVFGLPFVAVGVGLMGAPFYAALRAFLTAHVVTDRRLLTVTGGSRASVESRSPDRLTTLSRRDGPAGRGTLRLGYGTEKDSDGDTRSIEDRWPDVPDVALAEDAVRSLAASVGRTI